MGETRVKLASSNKQLQIFEKNLLNDIHALERMLKEGWFEIDKTRIGAEQEFCLVDENWKAAPLNMEMMAKLDDPDFTTELAKFNMEANAPPLEFKGKCLSEMEDILVKLMDKARRIARDLGVEVVMSGILPTSRKSDFNQDNITPIERYYALCKAINKIRGNSYELRIAGVDELILKHDSALLEAANTGFQVHLQVKPDDFVKMYNIAQAITGPVLAASTFSPLLFGKRLWKETRVALFQQSVDTRTTSDHLREMSPRVTFGNDWLKSSILDIYKEDIMRYRVLLSSEVQEDVIEKLNNGTAPELMALKVHNGTVYRWNRPCYGISEGKAHLRIENRVLPAGPTVVDEVANAALWLGLMNAYGDIVDDVSKLMEFHDAKSNFIGASRYGLQANMHWFDGTKVPVRELLLEQLIPLAAKGLKKAKIDKADIDRYMGILTERIESGKTGANWMLESYNELKKTSSGEEIFTVITAATAKRQEHNEPVHKWALAVHDDVQDWKPSSMLVEEFMEKDLFTVQKDDIIQLVAEMMDWQKIRYVAVENGKGKLIGLVTSRTLLREYSKVVNHGAKLPPTVKDIMIAEPVTISPNARVIDAMHIMEEHQFGCLPVVQNGRLVGMVTEQNFLQITNRLLKRLSK